MIEYLCDIIQSILKQYLSQPLLLSDDCNMISTTVTLAYTSRLLFSAAGSGVG